MLALLLLTCCLNAPLDVNVDTETLTVGAILPIPSSDPRAAVGLGYAPNPGLARRVARQEIIAKIQAAGQRTDDLEFPESILVHRRSKSLDPQLVKQTVMEAFVRKFPPDATIELISVDTPATSIGAGDFTISAALPATRFDPNQPVFVRLDIRSGGVSQTAYVRTVVRIQTMQPVLRTPLAANAEVRPDDVEWKLTSVDGSGSAVTSADALQGMLSKRDLDAGQILKADLFYAPLFVRKGDSVTVKATSGGVTISATMRAMAAGRLGDTIPVEHLSGSGSTTARVVGPRLLEAIQR
jgi:flagella basal body P-ring formation protein FlgA